MSGLLAGTMIWSKTKQRVTFVHWLNNYHRLFKLERLFQFGLSSFSLHILTTSDFMSQKSLMHQTRYSKNTHRHAHTHTHTHARTHAHTHTHTHTRTHAHVGFAILVSTLTDFYCFYTDLYLILPYTNPTPKLSPHWRHFAFFYFKINLI